MGTHGQGAALLFLQHTKRSSAADFQFSITACLERALPEVSQKKKYSNWKDWCCPTELKEAGDFHLISRLPLTASQSVSYGFKGFLWNCLKLQPTAHKPSYHLPALGGKSTVPKRQGKLGRMGESINLFRSTWQLPWKAADTSMLPMCLSLPFPSFTHTHIAPQTFHLPAGGHICFLPLMTILSVCFTENEEPLLPEACF